MSEPAAKQRQMINLDEFERRLGRPATPPKGGEDPLAELARLVGATEDRFNAVFQARPAAASRAPAEPRSNADSPSARAATPRAPRLGGDFAAIEAGLRGAIAPDFQAPPAVDSEMDREDWLEAPYLPPTEAAIEPPRSRLPLYATAAIIVLGMAGIGGSFALKRHAIAPHEIAMIQAAAGPTKIQASDTADVAKPDQDASILDKSPQPAPVAVVNRTEEPVDLGSAAPQASASAMQVASSGAAVVPVPAPPAIESSQGQPFGLAGMIEPKKVKTVLVRPDGTIISADTPPQQALPTISPVASAAPNDASQAAGKDAASASGDTAAAPPAADEPKAQAPQAKSLKVADTDADTTDGTPASPGRAGGYDVQLAAPASEAAARQSMAKLQTRFGGELAGHRLKYHQASVANKSVYRVRVVALSHEEATALCQKLQAKGGACFVVKD
jgi:hypothetical protein